MTQLRTVTLPAFNPSPWQTIAAGVTLRSLEPVHASSAIVLARVNGEFIRREGWGELVADDDRVEWLIDPPGDREEFRTVLQIAAIAAAIIPGLQPYAGAIAAANFAYNILVPPHLPEKDAARDVFAASVGGNIARLDEPIWRVCGVDKITPPFAGMPYVEFVDDDGDNVDNQQYFYAVLAVGYGPYDLLADYLGKTPTSHYQDVLVHRLLAPGEQPSRARADVWTSQDIGNFELDPKSTPGSYTACPPGRRVSSIGVDVTASQGLGRTNEDGEEFDITVQWMVQAREVDDAGAPIGRFRTVPSGSEVRTMHTNTSQRWSGHYTIDPPARVEVRVIRTNEKNTSTNARDSIQWVGLRGYSADPAPLDPNTTHYEIVLRASQNLSQSNQNDISLIVQGKCRTWNPDDGWNCDIGDFDNYVATRNPAWWLADLWRDPVWGEALPDERIDLQGLYDYSLTWAARQDRCDFTFSTTVDAWAASQLLARTGRARVFRRYGVRALKRDEIADLPTTAFSARMAVGPMTVNARLPDDKSPDGVIAQFRSNRKWDSDFVECPCPGVVSMVRPIYRQYPGIQGRTHALREGLYDAADMALRRRVIDFRTEMQAVLTSFLEPVLWVPQLARSAQSGDVVDWDVDTLTMELSEPIDFSESPVLLWLRRDVGTMTTPVAVTPGPTANHVVLPAAPDFELILDDGTRERPVFVAGPQRAAVMAKTAAISDGGRSPKGAQYYNVRAVIDNDAVHTAGNAYLPGPGDDQDPILIPDGGDDSGVEIIVLDGGEFQVGQLVTGGADFWTLALDNHGQASYDSNDFVDPQLLVRQWVTTAIDPLVAAQFEVFVAPVNPDYDAYFSGDALRAWLNLGTSRSWTLGSFAPIDRVPVAFDVVIRAADDGSIQTTARFTVTMNIANLL